MKKKICYYILLVIMFIIMFISFRYMHNYDLNKPLQTYGDMIIKIRLLFLLNPMLILVFELITNNIKAFDYNPIVSIIIKIFACVFISISTCYLDVFIYLVMLLIAPIIKIIKVYRKNFERNR